MSGVHRVRRVLLEIGTPAARTARAKRDVHALLARAARGLPALIESMCDEIDVSALPLRFDRLEVDLGDLGDLARPDLERELLLRLERELRRALRAAARAADPADASAEVLARFARTGVLPWWVDRREGDAVAAAARALAERAPLQLIRLLQELAAEPGAAERALRRIALALDDALLARICAVLAPASGALSEGWLARALAALASADLPAPAAAERAAGARRAALWSCALAVTARSAGARRAPADLLRDLARAYGARARVEPRQLLAPLSADLRDAEVSAAALRALQRSAPEARGADAREGSEPAASDGAAPAHEPAPRLARAVAPGEPADSDEGRAQRIDAPAPRTQLPRAPGDFATDPGSPASELLRAPDRSGARAEPHVTGRRAPAALEARAARERASEPVVAMPAFRSPRAPETSDAATDEEVYVENAGLVILWPFLPRFFAHLGLARERELVDAAAARRAAALLEYAATGTTDAREPALVLNKVLCGIDPGDVFELHEPLRPHELDEAEVLLRAVVERAPILRDMSTAGLRGTFLLRAGRLGAGAGRWLLRVERQTHDVVLDRFPWSIAWVKLPWMSAPLQVEW
jgi:hypothetical protein